MELDSSMRDKYRRMAHQSEHLWVSLQDLQPVQNYMKLNMLMNQTSSAKRKSIFSTLIDILSWLMMPFDYKSRLVEPDEILKILAGETVVSMIGMVNYYDAFELFAEQYTMERSREDDIHTFFIDNLINPNHGLYCCIELTLTGHRHIILKSSNFNVPGVIQTINDGFTSKKINQITQIQSILNSINTEYDRKIISGVLAQFLSTSQLINLGLNPNIAKNNFDKVSKINNEVLLLEDGATNSVREKLNKVIAKLKVNIQKNEQKDTSILSERRLKDHEDHLLTLKDQLEHKRGVLSQQTTYQKKLFREAVKRSLKKTIEVTRLQKRVKGAGAPSLLDSEDEEFIANSIEGKCSYHGRRHDSVMYTNHRIKSRDLLSIANYSRFKRGKRLLKSYSTVLLRSMPHKKNSIEGKKHCGKWLFCTKKPPKTEDDKNESIHYNRAFVKLIRHEMYESDIKDMSLDISMDDKAYVRPGTDVGFRLTRNTRILTSSDESIARKLPGHDFPVVEMCQTPSAFRVMTWKKEKINEVDTLVKANDQSFVEIRPKYYVPSSGSVWASSLLDLTYRHPDNFIISPASSTGQTSAIRSFLLQVHDAVKYYIMTTTEEDLVSLSSGEQKFVTYEENRFKHFSTQLTNLVVLWQQNKEMSSSDRSETLRIYVSLQGLMNMCRGTSFEGICPDDMVQSIRQLVQKCEEFMELVVPIVPKIKPYISELTDAGPGVGVSNHQVRFRFAELSILQCSESRIRVHRAPGDSGQNEAERTNSYIGDALVDGAALEWQHFKIFDGYSTIDIDEMSFDDVQRHISDITVKNSWAVANDISLRIDDEPAPGASFLQSTVVKPVCEHFFQNSTEMMCYVQSKSVMTKKDVPGHGYFDLIFNFIGDHCRIGKYFMDYQTRNCLKIGGYCGLCPERSVMTYPKFCQPVPDYTKLPNFHYKSFECMDTADGERSLDEYQPKVQLKINFDAGAISSTCHESIDSFSRKYIVPVNIVKTSLGEIEHKSLLKRKRKEQAHNLKMLEGEKTFNDYDWEKLVETNELRKKTISVLDKYLEHFSLSKTGLKKDKLRRVISHITSSETVLTGDVPHEQLVPDNDDLILQTYSESSDNDTDEDMDDVNLLTLTSRNKATRSGRVPISRY